MKITYRIAIPEDTAECISLRGKTRENPYTVEQLQEIGVTHDSWQKGITRGDFIGYVGVSEGRIVGYCFGDKNTGEVLVLALLPAYENKGIGKTLLYLVIDYFKDSGFKRVFLSCSPDPQSRSYGFYRHLGWSFTGLYDDANDEVLEYVTAI